MSAVLRPRGFTLIEVLLAITLLAMVMTVAYAGLRSVIRSTDRVEALNQKATHVRATQRLLHQQLERMLPLVYSEQEGERIVFAGERDVIRYVAPMPGYLGRGGPQVQEMAIEPGRDGDRLVFRHAPLVGYTPELMRERDPVVLIENIVDGGFSFIGFDDRGRLTDWMDTWEQPGQMPTMVSLQLELAETSELFWPDLRVRTRVDNTAGGGRRTRGPSVGPGPIRSDNSGQNEQRQ